MRSLLKLKAVPGMPFPVFRDERCALVVTGSGAPSAAAATGWALGYFSKAEQAVNIGFAGGASKKVSLYQWYRINAIRDQSTGRLLIPDLLLDFKLPHAALLTIGKPVETAPCRTDLVDMEGSGFFEAARHFLPPDKIAVLKWMSDTLSTRLDREAVGERFAQSLSHIEPILCDLQKITAVPVGVEKELQSILDRIHLTSTQTKYLQKWLRGYRLRGGDMATLLTFLPESAPSTKSANKHLFEELKHALKG